MKRKIFIVCMIFLFLISCVFGYKFFITGNNKNIDNIGEINDFILQIKNYDVEANVTIYSNKNSNTYNLKQRKVEDYQIQEINDNEGNGLIIENDNNKVTIKNTKLSVEEVFENYNEVAKNDVGFDSFIENYENSDDVEITENEKYYIVFVKIKNSRNKYIENKTLYIDKTENRPEKIEIKDVNNKETIIIEYTKFQIL